MYENELIHLNLPFILQVEPPSDPLLQKINACRVIMQVFLKYMKSVLFSTNLP